MEIRKVELETHEYKYGVMYEVHVYLKFRREPVIMYLPMDGDTAILNILDFLKRLIEKE